MSNAVVRVALVVEPDPALQQAIAKHLEGLGIEVATASDYQTAVAQLDARAPGIVCVNLALPRESGYELCENIRRRPGLEAIPILVMSDRASPQEMAHAEQAGANAFLRKPFTMQRIGKYVTSLLAGQTIPSRPSMRRLGT